MNWTDQWASSNGIRDLFEYALYKFTLYLLNLLTTWLRARTRQPITNGFALLGHWSVRQKLKCVSLVQSNYVVALCALQSDVEYLFELFLEGPVVRSGWRGRRRFAGVLHQAAAVTRSRWRGGRRRHESSVHQWQGSDHWYCRCRSAEVQSASVQRHLVVMTRSQIIRRRLVQLHVPPRRTEPHNSVSIKRQNRHKIAIMN